MPLQNLLGDLALDATLVSGTQKTQVTNFPVTQPVSGTVALSNPTETGLSKDATLTSGTQKTQVTNFPATQSVSGTVALSNPTETGLSKDITLTSGVQKTQVTNLPAMQTVTGAVALQTGAAQVGFVGTQEDAASGQGRYRFAGGSVATTVTSPNASITLSNPTDSGMDLILTRYEVEVEAACNVVLIANATSAGTVVIPFNPNMATTVANPGQVRIGSGVLANGTLLSMVHRSIPNSPCKMGPFRFRIPPGSTLTVRALGPSATNTNWMNIGWFSVPIGGELP